MGDFANPAQRPSRHTREKNNTKEFATIEFISESMVFRA
jgi:hypothetical protein